LRLGEEEDLLKPHEKGKEKNSVRIEKVEFEKVEFKITIMARVIKVS